jgi:hypothetical protein
MIRRTGSPDLPLHGGRVPAWLAARMATLGAVITEAIVHHYGRDAFLERLAHPFWFQSFGAVMGTDWHSSGIMAGRVDILIDSLTITAPQIEAKTIKGLEQIGNVVQPSTPEALRTQVSQDIARWSKVIADAKVPRQ